MPFFSIGYAVKDRIEINLLVAPANLKPRNSEWYKANVRVEVSGFTGEVEIEISISDIIRFKKELDPLYQNLKGKAEFKTIEGQLYILIETDNLGHMQTTGYLSGNALSGNRLTFEIQYDQTLLWHTISEIDELLFELSEVAG